MSEKKKIDWDKPLEVQVLGKSKKFPVELHMALFQKNKIVQYQIKALDGPGWDKWVTSDGKFIGADYTRFSLRNAPEKKKFIGWKNIYPDKYDFYAEHVVIHETREKADEMAKPSRIACLKIEQEYTEGEGLGDGE